MDGLAFGDGEPGLALLIDAEHDPVLGRRDVRDDRVGDLAEQLWTVKNFNILTHHVAIP